MPTHRDVSDLIEEVETEWIPMVDGRRLAVRLFLPRSARTSPVPVVLEYIPYRRRDGTRQGDEAMHRWFAAHGYACARVDIAGSGDSDGLFEDEYARREQDDGLEVVEWLASQPWSTGSVGMIGISWGGFNGLQIAARRPPALRAVISVCSTADRYHGDVHYTGGCLNEENLEWGGYLFAMNAFPPDPSIVGDRWREMWVHRIEHAGLAPADWLEHQRRDDFWQHGSVNEDYAAIEVPVLAVSGWVDGYTSTVFDLVENLSSTCKGIIGPWGHKYPQDGVPGPEIGFLQEATRWWDRWLKGVETGVESDPDLRLFAQTSTRPMAHIDTRPGSWIGVDDWDPGVVSTVTLYPGGGSSGIGCLSDAAANRDAGVATVGSPVTVGLGGGQWCAYGLGKIAPELPLDQRLDDAGSLVYDGSPLDEPLTLVGRPLLALRVASDRPTAFVVVRLNAVHQDRSVERLSYGVLNLCHRDSHEFPEIVTPGEPYDVEITLEPLAHVVPSGQRLRLSISTGSWPMLWPSPEMVTLSVDEASTELVLPLATGHRRLPDDLFGPPEDAVAGGITVLREGAEIRSITRDLGARSTKFVVGRDDGLFVIDDIGTEQGFTRVRTASIVDDEPLSATTQIETRASYRRGDWDVRIESDIEMTCDDAAFVVTARLAAFEAEQLVIERALERVIPRDHL